METSTFNELDEAQLFEAAQLVVQTFCEAHVVTLAQAASLLGRSPYTIRRYVREGKLQTVRVGPGQRDRRVTLAEIARFLSEKQEARA